MKLCMLYGGVEFVVAAGFTNFLRKRQCFALTNLLDVFHLLVDFAHVELFDLLLECCKVSSATAHAQFAFSLLSGVHGVLHSFIGASQPFLI